MKELQEKQRIKKRLYSTPGLVVLLIVAFFMIRGAYGVIVKERESSKYVEDLEKKIGSLSQRQEDLRDGIGRLETEEGIETEIKEKFSVSKPGERVVVVVDQRKISTSSATSSIPWYKRLLKSLW
ncbi:MAG: hypothetical protein AB200_00025 [Parcubacteria bacterium C7867-005]|nr:MAG: hypothetical protein AB200_00025 [Parcubacteria bacterium C7867-005]